MLKKLASLGLPSWVGPAVMAAAAASLYLLGMMQGISREGRKHSDYIAAQAGQAVRMADQQIQIVHNVEVVYRDRIKTITQKGEQIVITVPQLVTAADSQHFGVNAGFVRLYNAAWTGSVPSVAGAAAESDREPATVSLTDVADIDVHNATACRAWREQAIGLRSYYEQLRAASHPATTQTE